MKFKLLTALTLTTVLMTGCSESNLKKVTGTITNAECRSANYAYIQLDNGVTYLKYGKLYCLLEADTKVTIYHDDDFYVRELIVDGTKELKSKENNEQ